MSNFVVSARKYRPIRFDAVVGQQHVSQTLKNAIQNQHLAQAFLFCGPRGVGKTTCARILAKVLNCLNPTEDMEPCDTCESCQSFNNNASLNISELDAASNNSVEHIRALIEQVRFAPQSGKYKIYIIDEVHMLSQQAFNAFLKTLEEPPSYAIFILATTEKHKIIPTILSRCQIFDFNRIQIADMVAHLQRICQEEAIQAEEEALNVIAQKADGALRDALSIFDRMVSFSGSNILYKDVIEHLNILDHDYYFQVVDALLSEDASGLLVLFDKISRKGFDGDLFTNGLAEHLRNLLVCQDPRTLDLLEVSGSTKERYHEQAKLTPKALILSALSIANDCDVNYKMARNTRLHVEMALIKMAYAQRASRPMVQTVIEKKNNLDNTAPSLPSSTKQPTSEPTTTDITSQPTAKITETPVDTPATGIDPVVIAQHTAEDPDQEQETNTTETTTEEIPSTEQEPLVEPLAAGAKSDESVPPIAPVGKSKKFADLLAKKQGGGLLSKVMDATKAEAEAPKEEATPFTQENLEKLWRNYWEAIESPSTQLMFKTAKLSITDLETGAIAVVASNGRSKDAILRERTLKEQLILSFQKKTLSFEVSIDSSQLEKPKPKKVLPQTDREKYVHFLQLNPTLKDFQKRFQLLPPKNS